MQIETYIRAAGTNGMLVDAANMPAAVTPPTTCLGMSAEMKLHFFNGDAAEPMAAEDFEAISTWRLSVDDDYNQSTDPVLRFTSGITVGDDGTVEISIPNVSSQKLVTGLGTRASGSYIAELAGYAAGETVPVFVVQFPFNVLNRIDLEGGSESVPVEGAYYTNAQINALLSAPYVMQFSADGESWHSTQTTSDTYIRIRNSAVENSEWSLAIALPVGPQGESELHQSITTIPASTVEYTLSDGVFIHAPVSAPTYILPEVTDATITHYIELTVSFANTQSIAFEASDESIIIPLDTLEIQTNDVVEYLCHYDPLQSKWVIACGFLNVRGLYQ